MLGLDGTNLTIKSGQKNTVDLVKEILKRSKVDTFGFQATLDICSMKALIPLVPNLVFDRFNWYEEKTAAIAEGTTFTKSIKILTVNDCNKALSTLFGSKFGNLESLYVPVNALQNDSILMLIKGLESMPKLKLLDLSYVIMGPNHKLNGTKVFKK